MRYALNKIILSVVLIFMHINTALSMEIAITVDDLPANGTISMQTTRMEVAQKILSVFKKHHVTGVYFRYPFLSEGNTQENCVDKNIKATI